MMEFGEKVESRNRYSFNVGYQGSEENVETHKRFQKFSSAYDGVYISAIRVLLDEWDKRQEYECILEQMDDLERRMADLQSQLDDLKKEKKVKVPKTFGGE